MVLNLESSKIYTSSFALRHFLSYTLKSCNTLFYRFLNNKSIKLFLLDIRIISKHYSLVYLKNNFQK